MCQPVGMTEGKITGKLYKGACNNRGTTYWCCGTITININVPLFPFFTYFTFLLLSLFPNLAWFVPFSFRVRRNILFLLVFGFVYDIMAFPFLFDISHVSFDHEYDSCLCCYCRLRPRNIMNISGRKASVRILDVLDGYQSGKVCNMRRHTHTHQLRS